MDTLSTGKIGPFDPARTSAIGPRGAEDLRSDLPHGVQDIGVGAILGTYDQQRLGIDRQGRVVSREPLGDRIHDNSTVITTASKEDPVNHPTHYNWLPSGVEVIDITEHLNFNLGNAVKYILRAGKKGSSPREDLQKGQWYLARELKRIETYEKDLPKG